MSIKTEMKENINLAVTVLAFLLIPCAGAFLNSKMDTQTATITAHSDANVASLKHVQDGIADCLGLNDKDKRIEWVVKQRTGAGVKYGVEIELTEV